METCDRCGPAAEAMVILKMRDGDQTLALCAHHYAVHAMNLLLGGWTIMEDNRERLTNA